MDSISLSQRVLSVIDQLEPGDSLEAKVTRLAESELRRRLARYQFDRPPVSGEIRDVAGGVRSAPDCGRAGLRI